MAIVVANNQSLSAITALPSGVSGGAMTLLETQTASSSATISFTSNIDSTYDEYVFKFYDIHPATNNQHLAFQGNASGGSGYNETITSTSFVAYHKEDGSQSALIYAAANDQAQGTSFQRISNGTGSANEESCNGYLHLFAPSNTTFVKHFIARFTTYYHLSSDQYVYDQYISGYFNTTSAIDEIQFKFESGNIDSGVIKLYGIS
jgi:hypothetical protein